MNAFEADLPNNVACHDHFILIKISLFKNMFYLQCSIEDTTLNKLSISYKSSLSLCVLKQFSFFFLFEIWKKSIGENLLCQLQKFIYRKINKGKKIFFCKIYFCIVNCKDKYSVIDTLFLLSGSTFDFKSHL